MEASIPILDLGLTSSLGNEWIDESVSRQLVSHLSTVGFVYLRNHGVDEASVAAARQSAADFFASDNAFKNSFDVNGSERPYGYRGFRGEKLSDQQNGGDVKESLDLDGHRLETNDWPTPNLESSVVPLTRQLGSLARRILRMIGRGLDLENPDFLVDAHSFHADTDAAEPRKGITKSSGSYTALRILHYPLLKEELDEGSVQLGEHADWGSITLLLQDDVPGLEVQTVVDGEFILAKPIQGTIILNIGLMLENWTNGRLRATRHRVIKRLNRERFSIVFFAQPDYQVVIKPIQQLVDEDTKKLANEQIVKPVRPFMDNTKPREHEKKFQESTCYEFMQYMMNRYHGVK